MFDEAYFKSLHHDTFENLYEWAGLYRTLDMSKGNSLFCRATFLEKESKRIFSELAGDNYLKNAALLPAGRFAERLAHFQSELIALHPFYELNGRITRLFFDLIAIYNGYAPVDYSKALETGPSGLNTYIEASILCVQQADSSLLRNIILDGLEKA